MTLARVDNAPSKKTGEISLDLAEMRPVNVVTLLCIVSSKTTSPLRGLSM